MTARIFGSSYAAPKPPYVLPSRSRGDVMSARSARTAICVAQCCSTAITDVISAPAAFENVNESWKEMPNSAAPEDTSVSGEVLLYGRNCTSRPASRNQPSCWATNRPVWLVLGVQSRATRTVCGPLSPPPQPASSRASTAPTAARTRGARTGVTSSSLRRY
jgi:hypothetical protein